MVDIYNSIQHNGDVSPNAVRQLLFVLTAPSKTRNARHLTSENQLLLFRNLVLYKILETAIKHLPCEKSTFNTEEEEGLCSLNRLSSLVKLIRESKR